MYLAHHELESVNTIIIIVTVVVVTIVVVVVVAVIIIVNIVIISVHLIRQPLPAVQVKKDFQEAVLSYRQDEFFHKNMYANFGDIGSAVKELVDEFQKQTTNTKRINTIEDMQVSMQLQTCFFETFTSRPFSSKLVLQKIYSGLSAYGWPLHHSCGCHSSSDLADLDTSMILSESGLPVQSAAVPA